MNRRTFYGWVLTIAASAMLVYAVYHLAKTGNCSSTGYNQYGPVAKCPGDFAVVIVALMGAIFVMFGAFVTSDGQEGFQGVVWFYAAVAGGLLLAFNQSLSSGQQLAGVVVAAGAGILGSLLLAGSIRGVLQRRSTYVRPSSPATRLGKPGAAPATPASLLGDSSRAAAARAAAARKPVVAPVPSTLHRLTAPAANDRTLDQIAHLNDLHQQGALTDAEFQQAKAKLLSEL